MSRGLEPDVTSSGCSGTLTAESGAAAADLRKTTEADIVLARQRNADLRKSALIAEFVHDIRNSIAPVVNGLHVLRMLDNESPEFTEMQSIMERQLDQIMSLVDGFQDNWASPSDNNGQPLKGSEHSNDREGVLQFPARFNNDGSEVHVTDPIPRNLKFN